MRLKLASFLCLLALAAAITFATRQRTLNEVRAFNEILRQRLDAQATLVETSLAPKVEPINAVEELSAEERNELLRLRGQMLPLQSELQTASNRIAELVQAKAERPKPARVSEPATNQALQLPPKLQVHMQVVQAYRRSPAYTDADSFGSALRKYLSQNARQLPDDLAKVESYGRLPAGMSQRFEPMHPEPIPEEARSYTLFAREKNPQQLQDGWFYRVYFFADGTMTVSGINSSSPDWTASERKMETQVREGTLQHPAPAPH